MADRLAVPLILAAAVFAACESTDPCPSDEPACDTPVDPIARVILASDTQVVWPDGELTVDVRVADSAGVELEDAIVVLHSTNPAVATVDSTGRVEGHVVGTALIVGTAVGIEALPDTLAISVVEPAPTALRIRSARAFEYWPANTSGVSFVAIAVPSRFGAQLAADAVLEDGDVVPYQGAVTWTSSDTGVATIDGAGLVTGVSRDSTTITLSAADGTLTPATITAVVVEGYAVQNIGIFARAINDLGHVVGTDALGAALWDGTSVIRLGDWTPADVGEDGTVVGRDVIPVVWRNGVLDTLGIACDSASGSGGARAVSDSGAIVGWIWCDGTYHAVVWNDAEADTLPLPEGVPQDFGLTCTRLSAEAIAGTGVSGTACGSAVEWLDGSPRILDVPTRFGIGFDVMDRNASGWTVGYRSYLDNKTGQYDLRGYAWGPAGERVTWGGNEPPSMYGGGVANHQLDGIIEDGTIVGRTGVGDAYLGGADGVPIVIRPGLPAVPLSALTETPFEGGIPSINAAGRIAVGELVLDPLPF